MIKRIIFIALIAGLVYLNYTVPTFDDHKALVLAKLQTGYPLPAQQQERIWRDIDYSNFFVCSVMKTKEKSEMVSYGYLDHVTLINDKWLDQMRQQLTGRTSSY